MAAISLGAFPGMIGYPPPAIPTTDNESESIYSADESRLTPYLPQVTDADFLSSCQSAESLWLAEISVLVFSHLKEAKDLVNASEVCKNFFYASKDVYIWDGLIAEFLPNVQFLDSSFFSHEHQFKIIFQRAFDERKLICEDECNVRRTVQLLRGSNGFNGLIDASMKFAEAAAAQLEPQLYYSPPEEMRYHSLKSMHIQPKQFAQSLLRLLWAHVGRNFKGDDSTIGPNSTLGILAREKQSCILKFNNTAAFEKIIRAKEQSIAGPEYFANYVAESDDDRIEFIRLVFSKENRVNELYKELLAIWGEIQAPEFKLMAFIIILDSPNSTDKIARELFELFDDDLKANIKRSLWFANGKNDEGLGMGYGDHIIATAIRSPAVMRAIEQVARGMHYERLRQMQLPNGLQVAPFNPNCVQS